MLYTTTVELSSLRANAGDRFVDTAGTLYKWLKPSGAPVTRLRFLGLQDGLYYYAQESDTTSVLPPPVAPPTPPDWKEGLVKETFPADLNGAILLRDHTDGLVIEDRWIDGAYRAVETKLLKDLSTGEYTVPCRTPNLVIRRFKGSNLFRDGIRLRDADNLLIENFELINGDHLNTGDHLPECIAITRGHGIVIRDGVVGGADMAVTYQSDGVTKKYTNGDGIATEGGCEGIIERVVSTDNSDGGFDLKGDMRVHDCTALRCSRGFRFWKIDERYFPDGRIRTAGKITTDSTTWFGAGCEAVIDKLVIVGDAKDLDLITVEGGAKVTIRSVDLSGFTGTIHSKVRVNGSGNTITWPAGF